MMLSLYQLVLKTVNSARSAFACFLFRRAFFHSYSDGRGREDEDEETLKCKISIKVTTVGAVLSYLYTPD